MRDEMRRHIGRAVLVQLDGDEAIGGTLVRVTPMTLTLTDSALVSSAGRQTPADGEVVVSRLSVVWTQVAT